MARNTHKYHWTNALKISPNEAKFHRRGFQVSNPDVVGHLESVGKNFLYGYNSALGVRELAVLAADLNAIEPLYRGFAFEGAAMGLALLDKLVPFRKKLFSEFSRGPGSSHIYMLYIGIGWALARIPWIRRYPERHISAYDPLLKWLILDGYGFHEGYFYAKKYINSQGSFSRMTGYGERAFAQGFGRSLWFVDGANTSQIPQTISRLPTPLHADLWSGVGLACAYAGGVGERDIEKLSSSAEKYKSHLAQGAAFAAKARERAGNPAEHTDTACRIICGCSSNDAAAITDKNLKNLPPQTNVPSYEVWRQRIQRDFSSEGASI